MGAILPREVFLATAKRSTRARRAARTLQLAVQIAAQDNGLPGSATVRRWARAALAGALARVTIRIVDETEGRRLNRTYRGRNHATNVLSFAYDSSGGAVCGDVVLCAPVVRREAGRQGKEADAHFAHLVVHGLLHLQGYDHDKPRAAKTMESLETEILAKLGYPDPYRS
jgi:probable rRNA maturation factor